MHRARRSATLLAIVALPTLAVPARAITATVSVLADDHHNLTVQPGQPVAIDVIVTFDALQLANIQGDLRVTGDAGTPSNFRFNLGAGPLIHTGSFVGGSRTGIDIASGPPLFFGVTVGWNNPSYPLSYTLTFDQPGTYDIAWQAPPTAPNVRVYASFATASFVEAQTTYLGATITVLPAPASLAAVALAAFASSTRRRR